MTVIPFEIVYPGTSLDFAPDIAFQLQGLLYAAESCLTEAALALAGFMAARPHSDPTDKEAWQARISKRQQIELAVRQELKISDYDFDRYGEIALEVDRRILREQFKSGRLPKGYAHRRPFLYAKSFLYAVDGFRNVLVQIANRGISSAIGSLISELDAKVPALCRVRDSTAHADERVQGMARGKPIALKPIQNRMILAPGGALVVDALHGDNYGCTLADGTYGEMPVTQETFQLCVDVMQRLLQSFAWRGQPQLAPRA